MSAKFTTGPWKMVDPSENKGVGTGGWGICVSTDYGVGSNQFIAQMKGRGNKDRKRADAQLMASAPLLYEALEALEWSRGNQCCCPACGRPQGRGHFDDCKLNNALRAARGEG